MPVFVLEARDYTSPLFLVRTTAVLFGCLTFSLVASLQPSELRGAPLDPQRLNPFQIVCMFTWCFFFILTLLIHILNIIQFHSLLPISWKNLTMAVAALAALMSLSASVIFPWIVMDHEHVSPRSLAAAVASCLTFLAYCAEACVIRIHVQEQRGYMVSVQGFLKILQCWGSCQMIPLSVERMAYQGERNWQLWLSGGIYMFCLLMSLGSIVVISCDCAGRCPLPFARLLVSFNVLGMLFYMIAAVICFTKTLQPQELVGLQDRVFELALMETVIVGITLLAYTVDFSFSIIQFCKRG